MEEHIVSFNIFALAGCHISLNTAKVTRFCWIRELAIEFHSALCIHAEAYDQ